MALTLTVAAGAVEARIYKWVMPDGSVQYSDKPQEKDAKQVDLPPLVTYTPKPVPEKAEGESGEAAPPAAGGYDSFSISSPANDSAVRDNGGNLTINFSVVPSLEEGHAIDIYMDGRKFGQSNLPIVTLTNVSRGTHEIYGVIVDTGGQEIARTGTISVTLQRASVAGGAAGGGGGAASGGGSGPAGAPSVAGGAGG
ncbi:MAG: DUF4124 domain-containing protein [Gammaproteobacteria bacterium]|nr:DUF4124 domain-containing protein [Gammaproteobacteria bacterium]